MRNGKTTLVASFLAVLALGAQAVAPQAAWAAKLTIINLDAGTGKGLDDRTPVTPVGGNPGTTLGAQRLNAMQKAADLWGAELADEVEILVDATFAPLACDARSAFLGAAGPTAVDANFPHAPRANTWYPIALANKLAGVDLDPPAPAGLVGDDIVAFFNSAIDGPGDCLKGVSWYYGFDSKPPGKDIDFITVGMHELTHGLGALSFVNVATGQNLGPNQLNDVWNHLLEDMNTGRRWSELSADQRRASAVSGNVGWIGKQVESAAAELKSGRAPNGMVRMYAPNPPVPGSSISHFDMSLNPEALGQPMLLRPMHRPGLSRRQLEDIGWTTDLCGNGVIDDNELCDKAALNSATCSDAAGYNIGTLGCNAVCDGYDVRRCFYIPPETSLSDLTLTSIPEKRYVTRTIAGGYEKHPAAILELNQIAAFNGSVKAARSGPVTGFYSADPALVSQANLEWKIGIPVSATADTSFVKNLPNYEIKTVPARQVITVTSSVAKAPFDGMRVMLWLKRNGYTYTPPVLMEFFPPAGQAEAVESDTDVAEHPVSTDPSVQGSLLEGPTRIIVQVERIPTGTGGPAQ
jgi:hypothetical protein